MFNIAKVETLKTSSINFIDGNREVSESHVQKMYNLITENGFADTIKVVKIDNKFYAVEGQHRIEAIKLHGIKEVPCSVIDWLSGDFEEIQQYIIDLNAHNKSWSLYDYVKSWADKKNNNYIHLRNQMISYQKTLSNGVVASCYDGISRSHKNLKKGSFNYIDKKFSDDMVDLFSQLVIKWGRKKLGSPALRLAAVLIIKEKTTEDRYKMLKAFQISVLNHLTTSQEPIPDGDESFIYWFNNVVVELNNTLN